MSEDWLQALIAGSGSTPDWTNAEGRAQGILHAVLLDLLDYRSALTESQRENAAMRKVLVDADSITSLVAYRHTQRLPDYVVEELKNVSARARTLAALSTPAPETQE